LIILKFAPLQSANDPRGGVDADGWIGENKI